MPYFMIVLIPYISLLNISWILKCLFLKNMEPLTLVSRKANNVELRPTMFVKVSILIYGTEEF